MPKLIIYIIGIIPLGLLSYWLEENLGTLAIVAALAYLLVVRLVAERFGR